jgi:ribosome-associated protein
MDYVDFIVHVFSVEKRAYYGLERLRKSATTLSIADLNAQLASQIQATITAKRPKKASAKKKALKKVVPVKAVKKVATKKAAASKTTKAKKLVKKKATKRAPRR